MQHDRRFMAKPKSLQLAVRAASALVLLAGVGSVNPVLAQQGEQAVIESVEEVVGRVAAQHVQRAINRGAAVASFVAIVAAAGPLQRQVQEAAAPAS